MPIEHLRQSRFRSIQADRSACLLAVCACVDQQCPSLPLPRKAVWQKARPDPEDGPRRRTPKTDPEDVVNTDQGSQFTASEFTDAVLAQGCELSMDGRGAWRDNVFVERLWRSVKYERVYLKAYDSVSAARADIADYLDWYNAGRAHSSLDAATPDEHYFAKLPAQPLAA